MATSYKVLGQAAPSATTATTLYTVPAATETIVSTIVVCNRGSSSQTFRISVRPNGDTQANQHYLVYDASINGNSFLALTLGITLDATDVITVYNSSGDLSYNAFGTEVA